MAVRLDPRLSEIIDRIAAREGVEVVNAAMSGGRRPVLTVLIEKPGGVTLDDCARLSERLSLTLDVDDVIPHQYLLEVASPGLDRGLYRESDYERFAGLPAHIRTIEPIGGQRNFHGRLVGLDREGDPSAVIEELSGARHSIPLARIARANVEIEPGDRSFDKPLDISPDALPEAGAADGPDSSRSSASTLDSADSPAVNHEGGITAEQVRED